MSAAAGALLAQLTAVFNNLMELETEVVADIKENRGILKTATERHEKAGELHKESRRLLDEAKKERVEIREAREESARLLDEARKEREKMEKARDAIASMLGRADYAAAQP